MKIVVLTMFPTLLTMLGAMVFAYPAAAWLVEDCFKALVPEFAIAALGVVCFAFDG
jgi:hypothetical protein